MDLCVFYYILGIQLLYTPVVSSQKKCYSPIGNDLTRTANHTLCRPEAPVTHCCEPEAACLDNGLCFLAFDLSISTGTCTDKTWSDPACFQGCLPSKPLILCRFLAFGAYCARATISTILAILIMSLANVRRYQ